MSLIKFNNRNLFPWNTEAFDSFFGDDFFSSNLFKEDVLIPAVNIKEHKDEFKIEFAVPSFSKEDFNITVDGNLLTVSGKKKDESEEKKEDFTRKEFSFSSFKRSFTLPNTIDLSKEINATYKNGVLKLAVLKKEDVKETTKRVIEVN